MCCSQLAQDKMNWSAVSWTQLTSRSLELVHQSRQMSIHFLLAQKEDLPQHCGLCTRDWWHSQLKLGSVHHAGNRWGKALNKRWVLWSIAFPCQPHLVLSTISWISLLFNHMHCDIWAIILAASAKADRQLCMRALDDRSHKDVEKERVEVWKLHIPQGRVFCYLSKSNTESQLRAAHPALPGLLSESAAPKRLVVSKAVDGSSNRNVHVFSGSVAVRSSPTRITRAVSTLYSRLIPDYEEHWISAAGVLDTSIIFA